MSKAIIKGEFGIFCLLRVYDSKAWLDSWQFVSHAHNCLHRLILQRQTEIRRHQNKESLQPYSQSTQSLWEISSFELWDCF